MKIRTILTLGTLTLALGFTACGQDNDETAQLKDQVTQLEQQIKEMQAASQNETPDNTQNDTLQEDPATATSAPAETSSATDTTAPTETSPAADTQNAEQDQTPQYDVGTTDLSGFSTRIDELEQQIKDTTPTGSVQEQGQQFGLLKTEIDSIERELDYAEDDLEAQYKSGSLEAGTYRDLDVEIEALEDRLGWCEDQLELLFGIDD